MAEFVYTRVCHSHPEHQQRQDEYSVHAPNLDQAIVIVRRQIANHSPDFLCSVCSSSITLNFKPKSGKPITVQSHQLVHIDDTSI